MPTQHQHIQTDILVYGGTPGGVAAAIAASRAGHRTLLLEQTRHLGGLNTSGLNNNEQHHMHPEQTFGGICREFFARLGDHYGEHWVRKPGWFESHVFERELLAMLHATSAEVRFESWLDRVETEGPRIGALHLQQGPAIHAKVYIDATYEGDLLAAAGVPHTIGRESIDEHGESLAGARYADPVFPISPYDDDGRPLPGIVLEDAPPAGAGDRRIQTMNFRVTLTDDPANAVPIPKPDRYDPREHELLARCVQAGLYPGLNKIIGLYPLPNRKFECNNNQAAIVSIAPVGASYDWPAATRQQRAAVRDHHYQYTLGVFHFLATDPRVPRDFQDHMNRLGLCADEYADTGHFPTYLYVREARRMHGRCFLTQADITTDRAKDDAIALGSHYVDSHVVSRVALSRDSFTNEGRIWQPGEIFQIPYRAITSPADACENLLVPVCLSASHVANCAIRLEPTWMKLGESAAIAASVALAESPERPVVQDVEIPALQRRLRQAGQLLDLPTP